MQQVYTVLHLSLTKFDHIHAALGEKVAIAKHDRTELRKAEEKVSRIASELTRAQSLCSFFFFCLHLSVSGWHFSRLNPIVEEKATLTQQLQSELMASGEDIKVLAREKEVLTRQCEIDATKYTDLLERHDKESAQTEALIRERDSELCEAKKLLFSAAKDAEKQQEMLANQEDLLREANETQASLQQKLKENEREMMAQAKAWEDMERQFTQTLNDSSKALDALTVQKEEAERATSSLSARLEEEQASHKAMQEKCTALNAQKIDFAKKFEAQEEQLAQVTTENDAVSLYLFFHSF